MNKSDLNPANYLISPGYIFVPETSTKISAVLGSCVSISIFDTKKKIGGMNHFLYPNVKTDDEPRSVFGDVATRTLIKMFFEMGSRKRNLVAQIFGGAHNGDFSSENIGISNVNSAKKILNKEQIRIISEDTGGSVGRKIIFDTKTNESVVLKVNSLRKSDWFPYK